MGYCISETNWKVVINQILKKRVSKSAETVICSSVLCATHCLWSGWVGEMCRNSSIHNTHISSRRYIIIRLCISFFIIIQDFCNLLHQSRASGAGSGGCDVNSAGRGRWTAPVNRRRWSREDSGRKVRRPKNPSHNRPYPFVSVRPRQDNETLTLGRIS